MYIYIYIPIVFFVVCVNMLGSWWIKTIMENGGLTPTHIIKDTRFVNVVFFVNRLIVNYHLGMLNHHFATGCYKIMKS